MEDLVFTEYVQPIVGVPPSVEPKANQDYYGDTCLTSGWGYSQHDASGNPIVIPGICQLFRTSISYSMTHTSLRQIAESRIKVNGIL